MTTTANIPLDRIATIDMAPLDDGSAAGKRQVADAFRAVFERVGFFILVNHGVDTGLIKRTFAEAARFHAQPMDAKLAVMMNEHNNGYMAMNRYNVRTSRVSEEAKPDRNESFFMKRERGPDDPLLKSGRKFVGANVWPRDLPGFRETLLEYTDAVDLMAKRLLGPLALSLDLPEDHFDAGFAESQFSLRLSHYPPVEPREDQEAREVRGAPQYGIAPHTDSSFMTFLAQSGVPGLQIRVDEENWLDVPHVPDSFVVNSGDMLHRWTNGHYKSTPHRALPPTGQTRYAIPFFFGPHFDTTIECLPSCHGPDNPPQFPPITYGDYMTWWYGSNYDAKDQADLATEAAE